MGKDQKRILIVEDDSIVSLGFCDLLINMGFSVTAIAISGEEAVRQAEENPPDCILMDIELVGTMTGIEAARLIRARNDIPVVFITAFGDKKHSGLDGITPPEGYAYLVKPVMPEELSRAIESVLPGTQ